MVSLCGSYIMKEADQLLADQIFLEQREILYGMEDDGSGEDGGVKRMGSKGG